MFPTSFLIALGGAMGSVARFWLSEACLRWFGAAFPWGILIVNVTGCFIIGFFTLMADPGGRLPLPVNLRLFIMVGICGGYTTFSSFSLQTVSLIQKGQYLTAGLNILASVALCLLATYAGIKAATALGS